MKLLCTIQRSGFTLNGQTVESHRLYFDFLTRVGIDGHTPEIGSNGMVDRRQRYGHSSLVPTCIPQCARLPECGKSRCAVYGSGR